MTLPPCIQVLSHPRQVFKRVADSGVGFGGLFGLLALEYVIARPGDVTTHLMRAGADPLGALTGVWSSYVAWTIKPALTIFALGIGLYYHLRRSDRRLEIWAAASVLSYAWVPHILLVALGSLAAMLGWDHPVLPQHTFRSVNGAMIFAKQAIEYGPTVVLMFIALQSCRRPSAEERTNTRRMISVAAAAGLIVVLGLGAGIVRINSQWDSLKPVLPQDTVPAFVLTDLEGQRITHSAIAGQVTLIDFWATWCGPCVAAMPHIEALHRELGPRGLKMLSVNTEPDNIEGVRLFKRERELSFPIYVDGGAMQRRFRVQTYPTMLIVDAAGKVRHLHVGSTSMVTVRAEVEALLAEAATAGTN